MSIRARYMFRHRLTVTSVILASLCVLALVVAARVGPVRPKSEAANGSQTSSSDGKLSQLDKNGESEPTTVASLSPIPSPVPLPTFVAPGLHAGLENSSYNTSNGKQTITVTTANHGVGNEKLESVEVMLLDFTAQATVSRMEKRTLVVNAAANAKQTASFDSAVPRGLGHAQMLSISAVTHESKRQNVDLKELAKALAKQQAGKSPPGLAISEKAKSQAGTSPSDCYDWLQIIHAVAQDNNSIVLGSACIQSQQSFAVMFVPKR